MSGRETYILRTGEHNGGSGKRGWNEEWHEVKTVIGKWKADEKNRERDRGNGLRQKTDK